VPKSPSTGFQPRSSRIGSGKEKLWVTFQPDGGDSISFRTYAETNGYFEFKQDDQHQTLLLLNGTNKNKSIDEVAQPRIFHQHQVTVVPLDRFSELSPPSGYAWIM
jgi:hypothetical protein